MSEKYADPDVRLVVAFLNTIDVETGADRLASGADWVAWCTEQGLTGSAKLSDARRVRAALRDAATGDGSVRDALGCIRIGVVLDPDTGAPRLCGRSPLDQVLAAAVVIGVRGDWSRLKLCPAETCKFAFYDRSRNGSAHWCSMAVCGNRAKTKAFRERTRAAGG